MDSPNNAEILNDLLGSLANRYADAIIFADEHKKPRFWNTKAEKTFRLNSEEMRSNPQVLQFIHDCCESAIPQKVTTKLIRIPSPDSDDGQQFHRTMEALSIAGKIWHLIRISEPTTFSLTESELYIQSRTDDLSQLLNRRGFQSTLERHLDYRLALSIIDIDFFKRINDTLGHPIGDQAIAWFAKQLSQSFPDAICIGRLGGDEFGVVLEVDETSTIESRFQQFCNLIECTHPDFYPAGITVSLGVAIAKSANVSSRLLLTAGDRAMYQSKEKGRNQSTTTEVP